MEITITDIAAFKQKALQWAAAFDVTCYMDSNNFTDPYSKYDVLIAVGVKKQLTARPGNAFIGLEQFREQHPGWLFGFLTYDLKNEIEDFTSSNPDGLQFPDLYFFVPQHLIIIKGDIVNLISDNKEILNQIKSLTITYVNIYPNVNLQSRFSKADYINTVKKIQEHITRGDIYVTNFCQEFFAEGAEIDPLNVFIRLNELSPNPFSCFFKYYEQFIICASPERFLAKRGNKLISQPIKGTAQRQIDLIKDKQIISQLQADKKERQENVMIVDLVRNDLTLSAKPGTVKTEELFGIYSFNQVHQMISTVVCELRGDVLPVQAIKNTFPMGSMTGAPKISAMLLMEQYERSKRGAYSGAAGYFDPDGDFDFNVTIRSVLYNQKNKYLSLHTGSAITYDADPEKEYEECLLKASAIFKVLANEKINE